MDQYCAILSPHPPHYKPGVIVRTLLDRKDALVSAPEDKIEEEGHINKPLACMWLSQLDTKDNERRERAEM